MTEIDQNEIVNKRIIRPQAELAKRQGKQITNTATWHSRGESRALAPANVKEEMGRTSFIRPKDHVGGMANPTAYAGEKSIKKAFAGHEPTREEISEALHEHRHVLSAFSTDSKGNPLTARQKYDKLKEMGLA